MTAAIKAGVARFSLAIFHHAHYFVSPEKSPATAFSSSNLSVIRR
jgi:hypothetical protein